MTNLGFKEHDRYFVHEDTKYFIEFPSGPLGVGDAPVEEIAEIGNGSWSIEIINTYRLC